MLNDLSPCKRFWKFIALTFLISWVPWLAVVVSGQNIQTTLWIIPATLGGFGPSIAGIIMEYRNYDKDHHRNFWKRVLDFKRISAGWYLFIFLLIPLIIIVAYLINHLFGKLIPELLVLKQIVANPLMLLSMITLGIVTGPLSEELGWRGFALDQLQKRWSPLVSSLILAPIWWAWHLPLFFMDGTTQSQWAIGSLSFWFFAIGIVPLTVLMTWVYNHNNKSILAAILLHFVYNFTLSLVSPLTDYMNMAHVLLLFVGAAVLVVTASSEMKISFQKSA